MTLRVLVAGLGNMGRSHALAYLQDRQAEGEIVTGLLYVQENPRDLHGSLDTVPLPLNQLGERELCPGATALDKINRSLR